MELEDLEVARKELVVEIKDRENKALCEVGGELAGHSFKAVMKLKNGGFLLKLNSEGQSSGSTQARTFTSKFHKSSVIKPRAFHIVVQFVLLTLQPDRLKDLREIEEINGMDEGDILRTRWIKPAARCSPSQVCGHLILSFSLQVPANDVPWDWLYICHKKVYVEK